MIYAHLAPGGASLPKEWVDELRRYEEGDLLTFNTPYNLLDAQKSKPLVLCLFGYQCFLFIWEEKGDGQGIVLGQVHVLGCQTGRWRSHLIFVAQVNAQTLRVFKTLGVSNDNHQGDVIKLGRIAHKFVNLR